MILIEDTSCQSGCLVGSNPSDNNHDNIGNYNRASAHNDHCKRINNRQSRKSLEIGHTHLNIIISVLYDLL